ncbi:hypothetical protein QN277_016796 [Acacia crassicarpa]|uniref:Myb-like domain-containing protein n=1 Tax=Acacia crassicarpa TaxID=499986 RepID=A0AAE1MXB2_9FABA|nr:hypothetical protein QN277_016796 [Acacia crassicarpa]
MRTRNLCGGNAVTPTNTVLVTGSEVPHLNEDNLAVLKASLESNHDMADAREDVSKGNINNDMDEGSNRSSRDFLDEDDMHWNFLGIKSCFSCNEGGEVLVCSETDCPINLHAKCLCIEPKFDDKGNFYCPYCWYKRAWAEAQESRERALLAKKDLSKFFFQNGITSGILAENDVGFKTREPKDVMGNGSGLDYHNRSGNKSVHSYPLKTMHDQHGIVVEDMANADGLEANTDVSREENTPVHVVLDHISSGREVFGLLNNNTSRTLKTRFVEGQGRIKLEDIRDDNECVHAMIAENVKPLSSFRFAEFTDGNLPDYAFAKEMQEGVEAYADKSRAKDREKLAQNELNLSATDCSVSGTGDSDSEPRPMKSKTGSKNACYKDEVVNPETLGLPQRSSMRGCSKKLALETGKRKRLNWTVEEVNMLKEGVLKFGMDQPNIPWKKILEYGCHVFHSKRNTADLKDKWKHLKF